jgi:hypothetical protein
MKKNLLVSISAALAASWASASLVACSGDDTGSTPTVDAGAGNDSTVSDGGKADADAAAVKEAGKPDADAAVVTEGGGPDADATSVETGGGDAPSEAAPSDAGDAALPDAGDATAPDAGDAAPPDAGDGGSPPPPTLGAQIDRFGRPAINTALNHSFDPSAAAAGTAKDTYNADTMESTWVASYKAEFAKNLAILDSLDTICGNQLFATPDAGAGRYDTFASVLANDRMWVNTAATNCSQYFGVELVATGVLAADAGPDGGPTNECGGRKLTYDVIQTTYSAAALGAISGFGSGVNAVASKTNGTTFPYLAPPQ